jgi:hypothetical protein
MGIGKRQHEFETQDEAEKKCKGYHFTHQRTKQSTGVQTQVLYKPERTSECPDDLQ